MLNAHSAILRLLLWLMEMSAEEFAVQDSFGEHQITVVSPVWLPVLIALGLELMIVAVVLQANI
jgi:hypothetical protein